jgi:hypothetical protein
MLIIRELNSVNSQSAIPKVNFFPNLRLLLPNFDNNLISPQRYAGMEICIYCIPNPSVAYPINGYSSIYVFLALGSYMDHF